MSSIIMHTISGAELDLNNIDTCNVILKDLAHALSHINRFNGHTRKPYSVLSHSMCASALMPGGKKMEGLLHDIAEGIIGDITTPVKEMFPEIVEYEDRLLAIILNKYDVNKESNIVNGVYKKSPMMLHIDKRLVYGEHYVLRPKCEGTFDNHVADLMEIYWDATPNDFISRYMDLGGRL